MRDDKLYGARETGGLHDGPGYHSEFVGAREVDWTEPGLFITRLRMVSDPGFPFWDVTYCHGRIGNEPVVVRLPFDQLPKRGTLAEVVRHAKRDSVFAARLGLLNKNTYSTLQ